MQKITLSIAHIVSAMALLLLTSAVSVSAADAKRADDDGSRFVLSDISCVVQPGRVADLGSAVPGVLASIDVNRSDYVTAGARLAELESDVERATLQLAERVASSNTATRLRQLNAQFGSRTLNRNRTLLQQASISKQALDQVETESLVADMQLLQEREKNEIAAIEAVRARASLKRRSIIAPFDGAITERYKTEGEYVADDAVLQIASLNPLHVELMVPIEDIDKVETGMIGEIAIAVTSYEDQTLHGIVRRIDPVADAASASYGVLLELPNPDLTIPAGVRCSLDLVAD